MSRSIIKPLAITTGEPAGIGPDIIVQIAQKAWSQPLVIIGDKNLLEKRAAMLGLPLSLEILKNDSEKVQPGKIYIDPVDLEYFANPGELDLRSTSYVLKVLKKLQQ